MHGALVTCAAAAPLIPAVQRCQQKIKARYNAIQTFTANVVQHSDAKRRPAAEATLQSIVHLCRWVCEPLQGRFPTQQVADKQADHALELLGQSTGQ